MGNLYIPNLRLSIRVSTCGDGGGRSGKTDNFIPPDFYNELGNIVRWRNGRRVMGDLINGAVRHHIKYVDHPQEPNKIGLFNRTGSSPVLTTAVV